MSTLILDEYIEVLERLTISGENEVNELINLFTANPDLLNVVDIDADDNKFFECAAALNAGYILSGDRAVRSVKKYLDITVVSPREFVMLVKESK